MVFPFPVPVVDTAFPLASDLAPASVRWTELRSFVGSPVIAKPRILSGLNLHRQTVQPITTKPAQTNTPTESVGGNITTLAEPEKQPNQLLASDSIASVDT